MKHRVVVANVTLVAGLLFSVGCSPSPSDVNRSKMKSERKQQTENARKEMEALPKAFRARDPFRVNEPASQEVGSEPQKK